MEQNEKHYLFWKIGYNPITMYRESGVGTEERKKRNKATWDDVPYEKH